MTVQDFIKPNALKSNLLLMLKLEHKNLIAIYIGHNKSHV